MPREYQFPYELRHLVYFLEVARQLHFRKAAEALAIAQPALSRQIAQLEAAVGAQLFVRSRRRVELTPAGRAFAKRIEPVLRSLAAAGREVQAPTRGEGGHVRVAFTGLAMATVLPGILRAFGKKFPGIRLELTADLSDEPVSEADIAKCHDQLEAWVAEKSQRRAQRA